MRGLRSISSLAVSDSYPRVGVRKLVSKQRSKNMQTRFITMRLPCSLHSMMDLLAPRMRQPPCRHTYPHIQYLQHAEAPPSPSDTSAAEVVTNMSTAQLTPQRSALMTASTSMHLTRPQHN